MEYTRIDRSHLARVVGLFSQEGWSSYSTDPERTWRALTASGTVSVVAIDEHGVVGLAHALTDGEIASFLSVVIVARERRGEGIGSRLVRELFERLGTERCDLLTDEETRAFYAAFEHRDLPGVRLYRPK